MGKFAKPYPEEGTDDDYIKGNCKSQSTQMFVMHNNVSKFEVKLKTKNLVK